MYNMQFYSILLTTVSRLILYVFLNKESRQEAGPASSDSGANDSNVYLGNLRSRFSAKFNRFFLARTKNYVVRTKKNRNVQRDSFSR